jgi:hypothetical protein
MMIRVPGAGGDGVLEVKSFTTVTDAWQKGKLKAIRFADGSWHVYDGKRWPKATKAQAAELEALPVTHDGG